MTLLVLKRGGVGECKIIWKSCIIHERIHMLSVLYKRELLRISGVLESLQEIKRVPFVLNHPPHSISASNPLKLQQIPFGEDHSHASLARLKLAILYTSPQVSFDHFLIEDWIVRQSIHNDLFNALESISSEVMGTLRIQ
jgi:hypothetical protein